MPCQHLAQIQQLHLPMSSSDVLKVVCPICGKVDVCAYTPLAEEEIADESDVQVESSQDLTTPDKPRL